MMTYPYRLIQESDLEAVAKASAALRSAVGEQSSLSVLALALTQAIERMLVGNEPACTIREADRARCELRDMGSHFSGALADLYANADGDNRQRLRAAFARVFKDHA